MGLVLITLYGSVSISSEKNVISMMENTYNTYSNEKKYKKITVNGLVSPIATIFVYESNISESMIRELLGGSDFLVYETFSIVSIKEYTSTLFSGNNVTMSEGDLDKNSINDSNPYITRSDNEISPNILDDMNDMNGMDDIINKMIMGSSRRFKSYGEMRRVPLKEEEKEHTMDELLTIINDKGFENLSPAELKSYERLTKN